MAYILRKNNIWDLIFMLGFPYSTIMIFTAYGPTLNQMMSTDNVNILSSVFMIFLVISMMLKPGKLLKIEVSKSYLKFLVIFTSLILVPFKFYPQWAKFLSVILLAFTEGRIAVIWSRYFINRADKKSQGVILGFSLALAYGLLYISNIVFPILPVEILPIFSSILLFLTLPFYKNLKRKEVNLLSWENEEKRLPGKLQLFTIFILYISAGVTFSGIFPYLKSVGEIYNYYNVLPFVIIVPVAGFLSRKVKWQFILSIGILLLGFSYLFLIFPISTPVYIATETLLQFGWAFLDVGVWLLGAKFVRMYNKSQYQTYFVASFLLGTFIGSVVYMLIKDLSTNSYILVVLSQVPILVGIQLLLLLNSNKENHQIKSIPPGLLAELTNREQQIATILFGYKSNGEICLELNISNNTLKTHIRNIYRKAKVTSRLEFRSLL